MWEVRYYNKVYTRHFFILKGRLLCLRIAACSFLENCSSTQLHTQLGSSAIYLPSSQVDRMNGCRDNRRTDRQTDRDSFHLQLDYICLHDCAFLSELMCLCVCMAAIQLTMPVCVRLYALTPAWNTQRGSVYVTVCIYVCVCACWLADGGESSAAAQIRWD